MVRIVTAADANMRDMVNALVQSAYKFDIPIEVYDLGGLGYGSKLPVRDMDDRRVGSNGFIPCLFKIDALEAELFKELYVYPKKECCLAWLDADCEVVKDFSEIEKENFDVGVVKRVPNEASVVGNHALAGVINTGVIFFKVNTRTRDFFRLWRAKAEELNSEQGAMNFLETWSMSYKSPIAYKRIKIVSFDGELYNNYYLDGRFGGDPKKAKILHYKMEVRHLRRA